MAKIKEFRPKKEKKIRTVAFEQKIKSHRRSKVVKVITLTLIIIISFWSIYYVWDNSSYSYYTEVSSFPRFSSGNSVCLNHNGRVLTYSKDGVNSMDARGVVVWNETYEMQNPIVEVNKNAVAVVITEATLYTCWMRRGKWEKLIPIFPFVIFVFRKTELWQLF